MAELTYTLGEHPQIIELLSVLEKNNLQRQKEEVQALVGYIDGMEDKLAQMMEEMKEIRLEVGKLLLEELFGGGIVQDFARHSIHPVGGPVTVFLSNMLHGFTLGEETANDTVGTFITSSFTGTVGVAIIDLFDQSFQALIVLELRAIIYRDGLYGTSREF